MRQTCPAASQVTSSCSSKLIGRRCCDSSRYALAVFSSALFGVSPFKNCPLKFSLSASCICMSTPMIYPPYTSFPHGLGACSSPSPHHHLFLARTLCAVPFCACNNEQRTRLYRYSFPLSSTGNGFESVALPLMQTTLVHMRPLPPCAMSRVGAPLADPCLAINPPPGLHSRACLSNAL